MTRASNVKPEIGLAAGGGGISGGGDGRAALAGIGAERSGAAVRSGTIGGDGTSGVAAAGCRSSCARRLLANWPMICAAVAWIMPTPRPYCATAPDSIRSVWMKTREPISAGSMRNVAVALAEPRPLSSAALRLHPRAVIGLVDILELHAAGKRQSHRTEPHGNLAAKILRIDHFGQRRAGHARRDAPDVHQHRPGLRRRQRNVERIVEFHYLTLIYACLQPIISGAPIFCQIQRAQANNRSSS